MHVKTSRKEENWLAPRRHQCLVYVGGDSTGPAKNAQHGGFHESEIPVPAAHLDDRLNTRRVSLILYRCPVMHGFHIQVLPGFHKLALGIKAAGAVTQHGERLVYANNDGGTRPAGKELPFNFDVAQLEIMQREAQITGIGGQGPVFGTRHSFQHGNDVGKVLVRVPALPHPLDIELEGGIAKALSVENAHGLSSDSEKGRSRAAIRPSSTFSK